MKEWDEVKKTFTSISKERKIAIEILAELEVDYDDEKITKIEKKLNKTARQKALDCLNEMEVVESQGGEEAYALVENNEENRALLQEAGIPLETALKYGDDETFCIIALACSEGYATWYTGEKLIFNEVSLDDIEAKILERMETLRKIGELERQMELDLLLNWIASGEDY